MLSNGFRALKQVVPPQPRKAAHTPVSSRWKSSDQWGVQLEVKKLRNPGIFPFEVPVFTAGQQGNCAAVTPADGFGDIISCEH